MDALKPGVRQGRHLRPFFTAVCIYMRESTDTSQARIADLAGLDSTESVKRFERGKTYPTENFERYAAAYAYDAKVDPRDLIGLALNWWKQHGRPPTTAREERELEAEQAGREPSAGDVLEAIRHAEQQERGEASEPPISTRRKRAAEE